MKAFLTRGAIGVVLLLIFQSAAFAHCEIPCGIYDDAMRIKLISEHIATIEKSMAQITEIEKSGSTNSNQLVRWVMNKEDHANKLQEVVTQYFMTQRLKPDTGNYDQQLRLLHLMLVAAMKAKQTTDLENVAELKKLLAEFDKLYFAPH